MARVLVVDDSLVVRTMLRGVLTEGGHEVVGEAASGDEVLELVHELEPDLVTLDIVMPGRDGLATLRHLHVREPSLPVLMCSACLDEHRSALALEFGAAGLIRKPLDGSQILAAVDAALAVPA